jgi:hypothetical protein
MERREKILWVASGVLAIAAVAVSTALGNIYGRTLQQNGPARAFHPQCGDDAAYEAACNAWAELRRTHPFPWQGLVATRLAGDEVALIVAEPPAAIPSKQLSALVGAAFGKDLRALRGRWSIGTDGWVEDLVLVTRVSSREGRLLDDPLFRDRVALLHHALFGTTFGAHLVIAGESSQRDSLAPPNIHVTPPELRSWLRDEKLLWQRLNAVRDEPRAWSELATDRASGTFASNDASLVLLTFPDEVLRHAQSLEMLRKPFREFAVASDAVVGGMQTKTGQIAIVGRRRTSSVEALPPMRFETFAMLATQNQDLLTQSLQPDAGHERRMIVKLAPPLQNTELGALLHTSDQLLKSWSEAGRLQYQYFNYPKPASYPFKDEPLSAVLRNDARGRPLVAIWMADAASVIVEGADATTLTATRSAALPVAYGVQGGAPDTGNTMERYSRAANDHFARLRDPILARVVQYAMLHQLVRAFAPRTAASTALMPAESLQTPATTVYWSRAKGPAVLGGHQLDANVVRLRAGERLELQHVNGRTLLRYPLANAEAVESNADAIAYAITRQEQRNVSALGRLAAKPVKIHAPADALALASPSAMQQQPFGYRAASGTDDALQTIMPLAQKNACCVYVTASGHGTTYIATKDVALEAQGTVALIEAVHDWKKPLLLLGVPERQMRGLAAADALTMAGTLGDSGNDGTPAYAVVQSTTDGDVSFVRLLSNEPPERAHAVLQQLAETETAWRTAGMGRMKSADLAAVEKAVQWDPSRDGESSTLVLSPVPIIVVAGFSPGARSDLLDAHQKALQAATAAKGTRAQYLIALQHFLAKGTVPPKRVLMMIEHDRILTVVGVGAE